jgi:predicted ArsR family transcriptional regulator
MVTREEATEDVRLMARRTALLYYYYAKTLVEELGEEEGKRLIAKAIWAYGEHCGRAVREGVESMGLPPTDENFGKVADLPKLGWEASTITLPNGEKRPIVTYCPLAAVWEELGAQELGRMYCYVDQAKYHAYNPDYEFTHTKNVLDGDDCCEYCIRRKD